MEYAIANVSVIPLRREPEHRSEMVSQILFGECFRILEQRKNWCHVVLEYDGYEGWLDIRMTQRIEADKILQTGQPGLRYTSCIYNTVKLMETGSSFTVPIGSSLPFYSEKERTFKLGDDLFLLNEGEVHPVVEEKNLRQSIVADAMKYLRSPYLWGGRGPMGIDCSGFTQVVYKLSGIVIPRDASVQAKLGEEVKVPEEALPGDLAFFANAGGKTVHVGLLLGNGRIIHASGRVRIDFIDHAGILNVETHEYSHHLQWIKKII
ncbi:MAG: C40 family peptidase [Bacteroidota bacterium]|nr:C40 family peptidase [Bacteroidota bacterium]